MRVMVLVKADKDTEAGVLPSETQRCPNPTGTEGEIEIRPLFEADDFGAELTPELREQEERLRAHLAETR